MNQPPKSIVLGQQMADAVKNEKVRLNQGNALASPLPRGRYALQPGECDLLNPGRVPLDAQIRQCCKDFVELSGSKRTEYSAAISLDEFYTLIEFAKRAAVFSLRNKDADLLKDAFTALAIIEAKRTDFRDILATLAFLHHTAAKIGQDPAPLFRGAAEIAEPDVAKLMIGFLERDARYKSLRDAWGYLEVETKFGLGFVRWGNKAYAPTTDLLPTLMKIAAVIDADSYVTTSIELATELPEIWLKTPAGIDLLDQALAHVRAGATIGARLKADNVAGAGQQQFTVFFVETGNVEAAEILGRLSREKKPRDYCMLGINDGHLFCLVIARSFQAGTPSFENGESLNRFREKLHGAIKSA